MESQLIVKQSEEKFEKNKDIDVFDELEQDNNNDDLIQRKRNPNKKGGELKNNKWFKFIITNIAIILMIFLFFLLIKKDSINIKNKDKIEDNIKSGNILSASNLKLNKVLNSTDIYDLGRNKITKFPIESISQFPSGNIITVDWITINIYDNNFNLIQKISVFDAVKDTYYKKDQKKIYKVEIQNENNFAICANDGSLKIYSKQGKEFALKQNIEKEGIVDIVFDSEGKIICGARDNSVKIFKMDGKGVYKIYKTKSFASSFQVTLFEAQNTLISKDIHFIEFYDIKNNYKLVETMRQKSIHGIEKLENDKFIIYTNNSLKVVSMKEYKVTKTIEIGFHALTVKLLEDKGVILVGGCIKKEKGWDKSILSIYKKDTFELVKSYDDIHGICVKGSYILENGLIATFGDDRENGFPIKIWSLE
jgi:hypothetical protein